jgi:hypothetical protein
LITRRAFLGGCAAALLSPLAQARAAERAAALASSELVYVSPLRSDGSESTCHGEVWFAWLDGSVLVLTASDRWKARALDRGLDRARIWVGDYGRWKKLLGRNEAFRQAPSFEARAEAVKGAPELVERVLEVYDRKYPEEIGRWRERMRQGYADGSRVLIRYTPLT